jgi:hypothetical protein
VAQGQLCQLPASTPQQVFDIGTHDSFDDASIGACPEQMVRYTQHLLLPEGTGVMSWWFWQQV